MEVLNRLAKEKLNLFEDLAAYANMGDDPEDWKRFRRMCLDFFPITTGFKYAGFENLDNWMYAYAEEWHKDLAELPPEAMGQWVTPLLSIATACDPCGLERISTVTALRSCMDLKRKRKQLQPSIPPKWTSIGSSVQL